MALDYYDILGIPENAPQGSIARAAQARLREINEDVSMTPDEKKSAIEAVREAHQTIHDDALRAQYDIDLQAKREQVQRLKPGVKKKESYSYLRISFALVLLFAIGYFSITGYLSRQERIATERAAATAIENKKLAEEEAERSRKAAAREADAKLMAEQKRQEQERMLRERGVNVDKYLPPAK